jgi:hypothetical protein
MRTAVVVNVAGQCHWSAVVLHRPDLAQCGHWFSIVAERTVLDDPGHGAVVRDFDPVADLEAELVFPAK